MLKQRCALLALLALVIVLAPPAAAQEVKGHFSIGPSFLEGNVSDLLDTGWAIHGGATWFGNRPFGLRLDGGVDWFNAKDSFLDTIDTNPGTPNIIEPPDDGDAWVWSLTGNLFWESKSQGHVRFYVTGGIGVYYARWTLSEYGYGSGYYCDWYYCYPGVVPTQYLLQDGSSWEWGLNAGAGVAFPTSSGEVFIEADYHWIDTENTTQMIPVMIGYRW